MFLGSRRAKRRPRAVDLEYAVDTRPACRKKLPEGGNQLVADDGLGEVAGHAGVQAPLAVFLHGIGGERKNWHLDMRRRQQPQAPGGLQPVHYWHLHIHENQVTRLVPADLHGLRAIPGDGYGTAHFFEQQLDDALVGLIVLNYQYSREERGSNLSRRLRCWTPG